MKKRPRRQVSSSVRSSHFMIEINSAIALIRADHFVLKGYVNGYKSFTMTRLAAIKLTAVIARGSSNPK